MNAVIENIVKMIAFPFLSFVTENAGGGFKKTFLTDWPVISDVSKVADNLIQIRFQQNVSTTYKKGGGQIKEIDKMNQLAALLGKSVPNNAPEESFTSQRNGKITITEELLAFYEEAMDIKFEKGIKVPGIMLISERSENPYWDGQDYNENIYDSKGIKVYYQTEAMIAGVDFDSASSANLVDKDYVGVVQVTLDLNEETIEGDIEEEAAEATTEEKVDLPFGN